MVIWKKAANSLCNACLKPQTLQHVVSACSAHLDEGRYTWRYNSVLMILAQYLSSVKKDCSIFADIEGFDNPSVITGMEDTPDVIVLNEAKDHAYVIELRIVFESILSQRTVGESQLVTMNCVDHYVKDSIKLST